MGCLPMGLLNFLAGLFAVLSMIPCYGFVFWGFYLTGYFEDPHNVRGGPSALFKYWTSKEWYISIHHLFTLNMMGRYIMNFLVVWVIRDLAKRAIAQHRRSVALFLDIAFYFGLAYLITAAIASQIAGQTLHTQLEAYYTGKKNNNSEMQREAEASFVIIWNFLYRGIFGGYSLFCSSLWWTIFGWTVFLGFTRWRCVKYTINFESRTKYLWKVLGILSIVIGSSDYFYWVSFVSPTQIPTVTPFATAEIWIHLLIVPLWNLLAGIIVLLSRSDTVHNQEAESSPSSPAPKTPSKSTPKRKKEK